MKTNLFVGLFLMASIFSYAQQLTYKSRGNILNADKEKLSPTEVRTLFAAKPEILKSYNAGRSKKTAGNVFLIGGSALIVADLATGFTQDKVYPSAMTYIGVVAMLVAIPVKIGFSKKIRTAVEQYNEQVAGIGQSKNSYTVFVGANQNGIGLKITF